MLPTMSTVVHFDTATTGNGTGRLVEEFYDDCGLSPLGPHNNMRKLTTRRFQNLHDLLRGLDQHGEHNYHLIVAHGEPKGFFFGITHGTKVRPSEVVTDKLSEVTDLIEGTLKVERERRNGDAEVKQLMGMLNLNSTAPVEELANLLIRVRRKKLVISVRGCNIGVNRKLMESYKRLFNAPRFMAPNCRNLFLKIRPNSRPNSPAYMAPLIRTPINQPKLRRRAFQSANSAVGPLVVDITDIDGHTRVSARSFIQDPNDLLVWARILHHEYRNDPGRDYFILETMWEDSERSYHTPHKPMIDPTNDYSSKLVVV